MLLVDDAEIMFLACHDFASVLSFCRRALVFDHGRIVFDGPTDEAANFYLETIGLSA